MTILKRWGVTGVALCMIACGATRSEAGLVTVDPGTGTTTTFDVTGFTTTPGPVTIDGFSVTGNPNFTYGLYGYGLNANGYWDQSNVSTNNPSSSLTIDLGQLTNFVGLFLNYAPGQGSDPTITALDASGNVLQSYDLATLAPISTPGGYNAGAFRGIDSTTDDIRYIQISGSYILASSIEVNPSTAAVPEPSSLALCGVAGLIGLTAVRSRRGRPARSGSSPRG